MRKMVRVLAKRLHIPTSYSVDPWDEAAPTTAPGGIDGPPRDRPMADNVIETDPEAGARAEGDPDSPNSGRDLPP